MNINGLGSASWYTSVRSSTSPTGSTSSQQGGSDSVSFSAESMAALMQSAGPPPLTDEMASDFGAMLQEDDPELFSALDGNSDGVLSADEMKAGKEQLDAAMQAKGMGPPPPASSQEQSSGGLDEQQIQQLLQSLQDNGWSDVQTNQLSEILNQMFATSG